MNTQPCSVLDAKTGVVLRSGEWHADDPALKLEAGERLLQGRAVAVGVRLRDYSILKTSTGVVLRAGCWEDCDPNLKLGPDERRVIGRVFDVGACILPPYAESPRQTLEKLRVSHGELQRRVAKQDQLIKVLYAHGQAAGWKLPPAGKDD